MVSFTFALQCRVLDEANIKKHFFYLVEFLYCFFSRIRAFQWRQWGGIFEIFILIRKWKWPVDDQVLWQQPLPVSSRWILPTRILSWCFPLCVANPCRKGLDNPYCTCFIIGCLADRINILPNPKWGARAHRLLQNCIAYSVHGANGRTLAVKYTTPPRFVIA